MCVFISTEDINNNEFHVHQLQSNWQIVSVSVSKQRPVALACAMLRPVFHFNTHQKIFFFYFS